METMRELLKPTAAKAGGFGFGLALAALATARFCCLWQAGFLLGLLAMGVGIGLSVREGGE